MGQLMHKGISYSGGNNIDDSNTSSLSTWSSTKINNLINTVNGKLQTYQNIYGAKNLWDDTKVYTSNYKKSGHVYTNFNTDTRSYLDLCLYARDANGELIGSILLYDQISTTGIKEYDITIPSGTTQLELKHNGSSYDLRAFYEGWELTGNFKFQINVLGVDPTTVGGLSFSNIMIYKDLGDSTYEPYTPTNAKSLGADANALLGAHNLLPFPYYEGGAGVYDGISFTFGSDGSVSASGNLANTALVYRFFYGTLPRGNYRFRFVGSFSGPGLELKTYDATAGTGLGGTTSSANTDLFFTIDSNNENHAIWLYFNSYNSSNAVSISGMPILTLASDTSNVATPYAMTNAELTDGRVKYKDITLENPSADNAYGGMYEFDYRMNLSGHTVLSANIIDYSGLSKMVMVSAGSDDILRIFSATNGSIATSLDIRIAYI